ncbi:MAG: 30S ribosomal protein S15 [Candidatus Marinimicrobia bacterium]|mgnify:FL=1|nr:30S ribosomal protein S15 [Candidatus Neomarinimicrobiota bacterium]
MTISKDKTKELVKEYGKTADDTGSTESQISIFSERISNLTNHLKINKKDKSAQRGLMLLVSKRSRLLKYLKKTRLEDYKKLVEKLGIRK